MPIRVNTEPVLPPQLRPRSRLVGLGLAIVPAVVTIQIPGGRVDENVELLDVGQIFIATAPWTASVALAVWLCIAAHHYQPLTAGGALLILAIGAVVASMLQSEFAVAAEQAGNTPGEVLGEDKEFFEQIFGDAIRQDPRRGLILFPIGALLYVVGAYWFLYGPALWLAGLLCGAFIGCALHDELSEKLARRYSLEVSRPTAPAPRPPSPLDR